MITLMSALTAPGQHIAELIEQLADPVGNATRAARFTAALIAALEAIERVKNAPAVNLATELAKSQRTLEQLRDEAKASAAALEQLKPQLLKRLNAFRAIKV
jgi:hypothetical protein